MDSDDDFLTFSEPTEPSPVVMCKRLKRLKKSGPKSSSKEPLSEFVGDPVLFTHVDFAKIEAMENDSELPFSDDTNANEETVLFDDPLSQDTDMENEDKDAVEHGEDGRKAKRALDFFDGDVMGEIDGEEKSMGLDCKDPVEEKNKNNRVGEEDRLNGTEVKKNKKKQKAFSSDNGGDDNSNLPNFSKRSGRQRKTHLKELHAETQRVLRETRDASFKPAPVVHKPISAVLEKIRKRKLEFSKCYVNGHCISTNSVPDLGASAEVREKENVKTVSPSMDEESITDSNSRGCAEIIQRAVCDNDQTQSMSEEPRKEPNSTFQLQNHDSTDPFDCTEPHAAAVEPSDGEPNSIKEDSAPFLLNSIQGCDSESVNDSSSEEDYNDKENIEPFSPAIAKDSTYSASSDPVKDFIDEEAEEEYDSDNELEYIQGNDEDEDIEDAEGLNDIIATECEERPIDNEKRNELHQKWLEQQDVMGTDNLLQKLKCSSVLGDTFMQEKEAESDEDEEDSEGETEEDSDGDNKEDNLPSKPARINTRKAKQIILQMFSDKDDTYLSDGDDDSMHRSHAQHLLHRKKNETTLVSDDNGSAREVLGLIKNLNIVSGKKKRPKELSFFESVLSGKNIKNSSKSSFIGRASNYPMSKSSAKNGARKARSFIFGMDDSNSRSSVSMAEDSSDTITEDTGARRHPTAKYSGSQAKSGSKSVAADEVSLLAVLKKSSIKSSSCSKVSSVDLTKSIFGFRVSKTQ